MSTLNEKDSMSEKGHEREIISQEAPQEAPKDVPKEDPKDAPQDAVCKVIISKDKTEAFVQISPPLNGGGYLSLQAMLDALEADGVTYGIDTQLVYKIVRAKEAACNKQLKIAQALLPKRGIDSKIEYHFSTSKDNARAPQVAENNRVDYKQLGLLQNVREGDVLCTKIPATEGIAGINVLGEEIAPKPGVDKPLIVGKNTMLSEDGLELLATSDGYVDLVGAKVQVLNVYDIKGDVDYKTGNIDFYGNVHVSGNVRQGFEVRAEGNVVIDGCVEGGVVIADGNIFIKQGILGMDTGKIECGGNLTCKYIQNASASVKNDFETGACINSIVTCGGDARVIGSKSSVIGSKLTVRNAIECVNVGSKAVAAGTVLEVGSDPYTVNRFSSIPKEITEVEKNLENINRLVDLFQSLEALGRLDEDKLKEFDKIKFTQQTYQENLKDLLQEQDEVNERMLTMGYGIINATGTIYSGTTIVMGTERKKLDSDVKYTRFVRTKEGISMSSAMSK